MLVAIPLAAIVLAQLDRFRYLVRFAILTPVALIAVISILGWQFQAGISKSPFYNDQLQLIEAHVPRDEAVSASQSGTIGYFREQVVNLDGKVNPEALFYRSNMWEYLERRNIAWYCDWASEFLGPDPAANGWTVIAKRGAFVLYQHTNRQ
jgi:ABC-type sugar transport system permease subunit